MASKTKGGTVRKWIGLGALALSAAALGVVAPAAFAGPKEDTEQAENEFIRGNLILALSLWRKAADLGHAPAQARLGDMYDKTEEDKDAVEWYRKAAAQGNAAGEFGLGQMYAKGEGVAKDAEQAYRYTALAADKGYLPAVLVMREVYRIGGMGMTADLAKSAAWDAKAQEIVAKERPPAEASAAAPESVKKK